MLSAPRRNRTFYEARSACCARPADGLRALAQAGLHASGSDQGGHRRGGRPPREKGSREIAVGAAADLVVVGGAPAGYAVPALWGAHRFSVAGVTC
jgi:hypothetical protein